MIGEPLVSICVPTRNRADALRRGLPRILQQDYASLEFILSDNGSGDETEGICREAARRDPRIRYFRHPQNIGLYGNHNFCIDQARGEFLCFFHDHDERSDDLVREYARFLGQHPRVGVVCSDWTLTNEAGQNLGIRSYPVPRVTPGLDYIDRTLRSGSSSVGTPGAMIRRSALGEARFHEQGAIGFGDFPVWFRIAEEHDVGHLPKVLWTWRQQPLSQSARTIESMAQEYEENLSRYCDEHLRRWPQHAERVRRWRRDIRRYLFWALAFEVGLYFRRGSRPIRPEERPTLFEILDYRLDPEAFQRALRQMRRYRTGILQQIAFFVIQAMVSLKATQPLSWATYNTGLFRRFLKLC